MTGEGLSKTRKTTREIIHRNNELITNLGYESKDILEFADVQWVRVGDVQKQLQDFYESFLSPNAIDVIDTKVALQQASEMFKIRFFVGV